MSNSHRTQASSSDATFREAGIGELIEDVLRIGSAPTPSREAFVTENTALVAAPVLVFQPEAPVAIALAAFILVFTAVRWVVGAARWGRR